MNFFDHKALGNHLLQLCQVVKYPVYINNKTKKKNLIYIEFKYWVSQVECAILWEGVPYVKIYRYNTKHLCPKLNGYGDNGLSEQQGGTNGQTDFCYEICIR
jgi:hypothetical protein